MISEVYNCDCLEYVKSIPDKYFDLCVADPPYGIGMGTYNRTIKLHMVLVIRQIGIIMQNGITTFQQKSCLKSCLEFQKR
jgi:DNA modification methylase